MTLKPSHLERGEALKLAREILGTEGVTVYDLTNVADWILAGPEFEPPEYAPSSLDDETVQIPAYSDALPE